jgi:hypothetical protein
MTPRNDFYLSGLGEHRAQIAPPRVDEPLGRRAESDRNIAVDVLRAVAILIVMALHWVNSRLPGPATSPWDDVFIRFAGHGTYGVELLRFDDLAFDIGENAIVPSITRLEIAVSHLVLL